MTATVQAVLLDQLDVGGLVNDLELFASCPTRLEGNGLRGGRGVLDAAEDRL